MEEGCARAAIKLSIRKNIMKKLNFRSKILSLIINDNKSLVEAILIANDIKPIKPAPSQTKEEFDYAKQLLNGENPPINKKIRGQISNYFKFSSSESNSLMFGVPYNVLLQKCKKKLLKKRKKQQKNALTKNLLIVFNEYIKNIGGKPIANIQQVSALYNKTYNKDSIVENMDKFISLNHKKIINFAWASCGDKLDFAKGVIKVFLRSVEDSNFCIPKSIVNNIQVVTTGLTEVNISLNEDKNSIIIRIGETVTPNDAIEKFKHLKCWLDNLLGIILTKSNFKSFNKWVSAEQETGCSNLLSEEQYQLKLEYNKQEKEAKIAADNFGIHPKYLNNLFANLNYLADNIRWLSRYAKTKSILTFKDRKRLYEIKDFLLFKSLEFCHGEIVKLVKRDNPYLITENHINSIDKWCLFSEDEFNTEFDFINSEAQKYLGSFNQMTIEPLETAECLIIKDKQRFYEHSLRYLMNRSKKLNISFVQLVKEIYPMNFYLLFNVAHLPEYLLDSISKSDSDYHEDAIRQVYDSSYFWLWTIKLQDIYFHLPYIKHPTLKISPSFIETQESINKEYGRSVTELEQKAIPLFKVLENLKIDTWAAQFPNHLETPEKINRNWQNLQKFKALEYKYWEDLY